MAIAQSIEVSDSPNIFIGRQPIFDRDMTLFAYELLYRNSNENRALVSNQNLSTSEVIINLITDFGFDNVTGNNTAFINLSKDFLTDKIPLPLPNNKVVLEVLEDIVVDEELIEGLKNLSKKGFSLALDDFIYSPVWEPVLPLIDYIKVEIPALTNEEIQEHVARLKKYNVKLLAEKVESKEEYAFLHQCGFDYFQGYFFSRPEVLSGKTISPNKIKMISLLSDLNNSEIKIDQLVEDISIDVALCYKILRHINSAYYSLAHKVESIREAIIYVGLNKLRQWASLIVMSNLNDQSTEVMQQAIIRAYMCEQIAEITGKTDTKRYFSVGLLSTLETLLGTPMSEILKTLPLSEEIQDALLFYTGDIGKLLQCSIAYENSDWEGASQIDNINAAELRECYFNALTYAQNTMSMIE